MLITQCIQYLHHVAVTQRKTFIKGTKAWVRDNPQLRALGLDTRLSMKDVCGVERGKCTACECKAFTCVTPGGVRCEYCDHTPGQHVKIVELGECLSPRCSGGNCMKYMSESRAEYSTCLYCGCEASDHKAAHGQTPSSQFRTEYRGTFTTTPIPYTSATPTPSTDRPADTCIFPGCTFPKRQEGSKTHDFCSRTCARNYQSLQGTSMTTTPSTTVASYASKAYGGAGMYTGGVYTGGMYTGGMYTGGVPTTHTSAAIDELALKAKDLHLAPPTATPTSYMCTPYTSATPTLYTSATPTLYTSTTPTSYTATPTPYTFVTPTPYAYATMYTSTTPTLYTSTTPTPYTSATPTPSTDRPADTCIFPGCTFPKRQEGSKTHDFCSRTCARKYQSLQAIATATTTPSTTSYVLNTYGGGSSTVTTTPSTTSYLDDLKTYGGGASTATTTPSTTSYDLKTYGGGTSKITTTPSTTVASYASTAYGGGQTTSATTSQSGGGSTGIPGSVGKLCRTCKTNPPNSGYPFCESCFRGKGPVPPSYKT